MVEVTLLARLDRAESALTTRQRFLIALSDWHQGRTTAPEVSRLAESERPEYNRYSRLVLAANDRLGGFCWMLQQGAVWLEDGINTAALLDEAAGILEEQESIPREKPSRSWRKQKEVAVPTFLRGVALELRDTAAGRLDEVYRQLAAIEGAWDEAAAELGVDPVHPEIRQRAASLKKWLLDTRHAAGARKTPPAPTAEDVATMRQQLLEAAGVQSPSALPAGTPL